MALLSLTNWQTKTVIGMCYSSHMRTKSIPFYIETYTKFQETTFLNGFLKMITIFSKRRKDKYFFWYFVLFLILWFVYYGLTANGLIVLDYSKTHYKFLLGHRFRVCHFTAWVVPKSRLVNSLYFKKVQETHTLDFERNIFCSKIPYRNSSASLVCLLPVLFLFHE